MKIKVSLFYELDVTDWYEDEKLNKNQKLKKLEEDLSDISVHYQHCNYKTLTGCKVEDISLSSLDKLSDKDIKEIPQFKGTVDVTNIKLRNI